MAQFKHSIKYSTHQSQYLCGLQISPGAPQRALSVICCGMLGDDCLCRTKDEHVSYVDMFCFDRRKEK